MIGKVEVPNPPGPEELVVDQGLEVPLFDVEDDPVFDDVDDVSVPEPDPEVLEVAEV